jgi:hypothetical protein
MSGHSSGDCPLFSRCTKISDDELILWSTVQAVQNFPTFYLTQRHIAVSTKPPTLKSYFFKIHFNIILRSIRRSTIHLPSGFYSIFYIFLIVRMHAACPTDLIPLIWLSNSLELSPSDTNRYSATQEISRILRSQNFHYRVHKSLPVVSILSQPNPLHIVCRPF